MRRTGGGQYAIMGCIYIVIGIRIGMELDWASYGIGRQSTAHWESQSKLYAVYLDLDLDEGRRILG